MSQAFFRGVGVGEAGASAASATVQWLARDMVSMASSVAFAHGYGARFGGDVKKYRLFADVINDAGLTLQLLSPLAPGPYGFLAAQSLGCVCTALCGVAAGSTRAAISQHFARNGDVADLHAKEGVQENVVTLVGIALGMLVARLEAGQWLVFALLTLLHVYANVRAVDALVLTTLNERRAARAAAAFVRSGRVPTPAEAREPVLRRCLAAPGTGGVRFGARVSQLDPDDVAAAAEGGEHGAPYLLVQHGVNECAVLVRPDAPARERLRGVLHAHALVALGPGDAARLASASFEAFEEGLREAGWDAADESTTLGGKWRCEW